MCSRCDNVVIAFHSVWWAAVFLRVYCSCECISLAVSFAADELDTVIDLS
jgi:hypothetical protein